MDKQVMHLNTIFFSHPQSFSPTFCPQKPWPSSLETPTLQSLLEPHFRVFFSWFLNCMTLWHLLYQRIAYFHIVILVRDDYLCWILAEGYMCGSSVSWHPYDMLPGTLVLKWRMTLGAHFQPLGYRNERQLKRTYMEVQIILCDTLMII